LRFIFDPATLSPALISEIFVVSSVGEKKKKKKKKERKKRNNTRHVDTREAPNLPGLPSNFPQNLEKEKHTAFRNKAAVLGSFGFGTRESRSSRHERRESNVRAKCAETR
jgi:hypothetical protein